MTFFVVGSELVVLLALGRILEHFIGFGDLLELLLGAGFFVHIRVILASQRTIGAFDLVCRGFALDTECFVIVFKFDCHTLKYAIGAPVDWLKIRFYESFG